MALSLFALLCLIVIAIFSVLMFFTTAGRNRVYIMYILLAYPLLQLDMVPGKFSISTFDFLTYLFLLVFYRRRSINVQGGYLYLFLFLLVILASVIGCINAQSLSQDTAIDFIKLISIFIFAKILIDECLEDSSFFYIVLSCLRISLIVSLVFLIGQFIFGVGLTIAKEQNPNVLAEGVRYTSYFQDPQKYAQFLAAVSFLFLVKKDKKPISKLNYLLLFFSLVALLFTGGRAGFGGWCVGLFLVVLFSKSNYRFAFLLTGALLVLVMYNFKEHFSIFQRTSLNESYEFRYEIWKDAYGIFRKNPFFGIGLGNYANYVSIHNPDQYWLVDNQMYYFDHPESGYLKFLTELGILGFASVMLLVLIPIFRGFVLYLRTRNISSLLLIASVVSWMIGFYTVYSFGDVRIKILIVTLLCLLITSYKRVSLENAK